MSFDLDPDTFADLLAEPLGARPDVVACDGGLVVRDPLPLKVTITQGEADARYDVRCLAVMGQVPLGLAYMAVNAVNQGTACGAPARVAARPDGLHLVVEQAVYGPIRPGAEFPHAIRSVLDGVLAVGSQIEELRGMFTAVAQANDAAGPPSPAPAEQPPAEPAPPVPTRAPATPGYL
jgi:hypothetical protein